MKDTAVIMSVYYKDRLKFVKEAVQSILNQTYKDFDFFISLDGPVDAQVEQYLLSIPDERIKLKKIEKNGGLARALNHLLEFVMADPQYRFIARMDADDISIPERFEKQRQFFLSNEDISCVGSWYEEIDEYGQHLSYRMLPSDPELLKKRYLTRTPFAHSSVMFRSNILKITGVYPIDTIFMEDNVLWGKMLVSGYRFSNISLILLKYRIDRNYYKRRSGIRYGWRFLLTKMKISKLLGIKFLSYSPLLIIGLIKMLPAFIVKYIYRVSKII